MHRTCALSLLVVLFAVIGVAVVAGSKLTEPRLSDVGAPPATLSAQSVEIRRENSAPISGWYVPGTATDGSILLLHGVRSNRTQMLGRARFLNSLGYEILLIDLQAHGETLGTHVTFGYRESRDVEEAVPGTYQ